jgi:hypothetical protein
MVVVTSTSILVASVATNFQLHFYTIPALGDQTFILITFFVEKSIGAANSIVEPAQTSAQLA